jgi:hypothetical protein
VDIPTMTDIIVTYVNGLRAEQRLYPDLWAEALATQIVTTEEAS